MSDSRTDWYATPKVAVTAVVAVVGRRGRLAVSDLYDRLRREP